MGATEQTIALMTDMVATLKRIEKLLTASAPKDVASDQELDSQYGDEKIRFDPRNWKGQSCKGRTMSQCPAEFLDMLADGHDYFAQKNSSAGEDKKSRYDRMSAARARGWAKRIRAGWKPPVTEDDSGSENESEQPAEDQQGDGIENVEAW